jgi:hypothetical protein
VGLFGGPPRMTVAEAFGHYTELVSVALVRMPHLSGLTGARGSQLWQTALGEALHIFGGNRSGTRGQRALRARQILDELQLADAVDAAALAHVARGGTSRDFRPDLTELANAQGIDELPRRRL